MPYIKAELREALEFLNPLPANPGELNFAISALLHRYIGVRGISYENLNSVLGVMNAANAEFYRTVVAPYEDIKSFENGSVSELDKVFFTGIRTNAPAGTPIPGPGVDIATLTAAIVGALKKAEAPVPRKAKSSSEKATEVLAKTTTPFQPAKEAPLKPGEARVLQGPIPGDTPAPARSSAPPRVTKPAQDRIPPPGKDASPGEKALYELAEGDDDL